MIQLERIIQMAQEAQLPQAVKKEIKTAATKAKSADTKAEKALSQDERQKAELKKLSADVASLKKKGLKKKQLSEYNLFVKRQLKQGRTFLQAVRLWKRQQKATKSLRKKTTKPLKKKVVKVKKKAKVVKKKTVKPKASSVKRVIRTIRRHTAGAVVPNEQLKSLAEKISGLEKKLGSASVHVPQNTSPFFLDILGSQSSDGAHEVSDEEIALKLAGLYFKEVARLGFKRSLELDSVINAYFYSLARIKRKGVESKDIISAVRDSQISSKGF